MVNKTPEKIIIIPPELVDVTGFMPIIDHKMFQRLDGKHQTGLLYKIYRGANHTRFEHSVGVFGIAQNMAMVLGLNEEESRAVQAYALLHDIAHIPFSHNIEPLLSERHNTKADEFLAEFKEALEKSGINYDLFLAIARKGKDRNPLSKLVKHGVVGADKLDYMFRDPHHIGRKDMPDTANLIRYLVFDGKELMVEEKNDNEVMRTMNLYYDLHTFFYYIKQYLINQRILQRAVQESLDAGYMQEGRLYEWVDSDLESHLLNSESSFIRELFDTIRHRGDTYKSLVVFRLRGYESQERIAGKPFSVYPISEEAKDKFLSQEGFGTPRLLTSLERDIERELKFPDGTFLVTTILDFDRLSQPADVLLYSKDGSRTSLFERYPIHKQRLLDIANQNFSIRVAVRDSIRAELHKEAEKIKGYIEDRLRDIK